MMVPLGGQGELIRQFGCMNETVAQVFRLGKTTASEPGDVAPAAFKARMRESHAAAEGKRRNASLPGCLTANVQSLAKLVNLSDTDCRIMEFAVLSETERYLALAASLLGSLSMRKLVHTLSVVLDLSEPAVRASLSGSGVLTRSGLLSVNRNAFALLNSKLNLLSDDFADHVHSSEENPILLLRDVVVAGAAPHLGLDDFRHVDQFLKILHPYLRVCLGSGRKGVNIYLHGASGTGKSQLAKALAKALDCDLFEVASEDSKGNGVSGGRRLRALRAAQSVLAQQRALIVFDSVEDVFSDGGNLSENLGTAQTRKAWINRWLEGNPVPTFWLSNSIDGLDPAFIRRFDLVFEMPVPPKAVRQRIVQDACSGMVDEASLQRIADSDVLAPAVVTKAASVVRAIGAEELGAGCCAGAIELPIGYTLLAQGHLPLRRADAFHCVGADSTYFRQLTGCKSAAR